MKKVLLLLIAGSLFAGVAAYAAIGKPPVVAKNKMAR